MPDAESAGTGQVAVTYDVVYFVRESRTNVGAAGAKYSYGENGANFNTANTPSSGVKSVVIANYDTSVMVTKLWQNQAGQSTSDAHADDKVTYELWKARVKRSDETGDFKVGTNADEYSGLTFVDSDEEHNGGFSSFELVEEKEVSHGNSNDWKQEWTGLPQYETVDGKAYKLVYFVREKDAPSATYSYVYPNGYK